MPPPRTASPVLRDLFNTAKAKGIRNKQIAYRNKVAAETVSNWKRGAATPSILTVEELAASLGYRLILAPIGDDFI